MSVSIRKSPYILPSLKIGNLSAGNYCSINNDGHFKMFGKSTYYLDESTDVSKIKVVGVGIIEDSANNGILLQKTANLSDYIYFNIQTNHDRGFTTPIDFHFHWRQAQNNMPNFLLEYRIQVNGQPETTAWTRKKIVTNKFTYSSGSLNQISEFVIPAPINDNVSNIINIRMYRDNANTSTLFAGADPYTLDVLLRFIDIHKVCDSLGSDEEYVK